MKKFAKEYIAKVLYKLEKSGEKRARPPPPLSSSSTRASTSNTAEDTPNSIENADIDMAEITLGDFGIVSGSDEDESEGEGEGGSDDHNEDPRDMDKDSPPQHSSPVTGEADVVEMEISQQPSIQPPADPRRRPPIETQQSS